MGGESETTGTTSVLDRLKQVTGLSHQTTLVPSSAEGGVPDDNTPDNEYIRGGVEILRPLKEVIIRKVGYSQKDIDFTDQIQSEFAYYSNTRQLEVNSPRMAILQQSIDDMTAGTNIAARVVIMHKGQAPEAFAAPDGTIFISQSLINLYDTLDEVVGILAHEVSHLVRKTFDKEVSAGGAFTRLGVGWLHEATADNYDAMELLEKADYNSFAFSKAIVKLPNIGRDVAHQTNDVRGAESFGMHLIRHFRTSNKAETPLQAQLKGAVKATNLELLGQATKENDGDKMVQVLKYLHHWDLKAVYEHKAKGVEWGRWFSRDSIQQDFADLIQGRLKQSGFSQNEITAFIIVTQGPRRAGYIAGSGKMLEIAKEIVRDNLPLQMRRMYLTLFDQRYDKPSGNARMASSYLYELSYNLIDETTRTPNQTLGINEIPVTEETILEVLSLFNRYSSDLDVGEAITRVLIRFAAVKCLPENKAGEIGPEAVREFFIKAKSKGILPRIDTSAISREGPIIMQAFNEVFVPPQEKLSLSFDEIDYFFRSLGEAAELRRDNLRGFVRKIQQYFQEEDLDEAGRLPYIQYIERKIIGLTLEDIETNIPLLDYLAGSTSRFERGYIPRSDPKELFEGDKSLNLELIKFNLKMIFGLALFKQDSENFYQYMGRAMNGSGIQIERLSNIQMTNLCRILLDCENNRFLTIDLWAEVSSRKTGLDVLALEPDGKVIIADFESFLKMPFMEEIRKRNEQISFSNIQELVAYLSEYFNNVHPPADRDLYTDSIRSILTGQAIRTEFDRLVKAGIDETYFNSLYEYLDKYFPKGEQTNKLKREISRRYLKNPGIDLKKKIQYFLDHSEQLGIEGALLIGEHIHTLEQYRMFKQRMGEQAEKYLSGATSISIAAVADFASTFLPKSFERLLETCLTDAGSQQSQSTFLAKNWVELFLSNKPWDRLVNVKYEPASKKMVVRAAGRRIFRSISDTMSFLKNLSTGQRFAIAFKALIDREGAFSTPENKEKLGDFIVQALNLTSGFAATAMKQACRYEDSKVMVYPIARLLNGLLFRGLNPDAVDTSVLSSNSVPAQDWPMIAHADTRSLIFFGEEYAHQPQSLMACLAQQSNNDYFVAVGQLEQQLFQSEENDPFNKPEEEALDPTAERLIQAVEASGTLGVRSFQISRHFYAFSPEVDRRLSRCNDAQKGLSKLGFWWNLDKYMGENAEIARFIETRLVSLDEYLGGGSLFTTYAAKILGEDGLVKEAVLRQLNPNPEGLIGNFYKLARDTLEAVKDDKTPAYPGENLAERRRLADLGLLLISLSQAWCIRDVNDKNFVERDALFRQTVSNFNKKAGNADLIAAPGLIFDSIYIKSETRAVGRTLNQLLNDQEVSQSVKQEALKLVARFYGYQLRGQTFQDEQGKAYRLVHSDPHPGNFIVDLEGDTIKQVSVVDRGMYLKLANEDVGAIAPLVKEKGGIGFAVAFVNRLIELNKTRNPLEKTRIAGRFSKAVISRFGSQLLARGVDNMILLRSLYETMLTQGMDVPLEMQLGVKNIQSLKELMKRYNLRFEDYY